MSRRMSKKETEGCCQCFICLIAIGLIIIAISLVATYWYISLPIIVCIVLIAYIYTQKQREKLIRLLDTIPNQDEFRNITGFVAIENGQLTSKYKEWLLKKAKVKPLELYSRPQTIFPNYTRTPQAQQQEPTHAVPINYPETTERETIYCPYCGNSINKGSKFCTSCGNAIN